MSRGDCNPNYMHPAVWGELAIISCSGFEKKSMLLDKGEYTIGRSRHCDIRISIKTVSRIHVRIKYDKSTGNMSLFNCGSEEDLFVNENHVKPKDEVSLTYGDIINLSERRFKLKRPQEENSVILDETELCSQPPILEKSPEAKRLPGGGTRGSNDRWDLMGMQDFHSINNNKQKADASTFGKIFGSQVGKSPFFRMSDDMIGTPDAELNRKTSKTVRFSYFNEMKINGQRVYSPARKRRRIAHRMQTPGPRVEVRSRQLPQAFSRNLNSKKRMSWRQVINKTREGAGGGSQRKQQVKPKRILTPFVKLKTVDDRRKEIMRRLLGGI